MRHGPYNLLSLLNRRGIARLNRYELLLPALTGANDSEFINLLCRSTSMPGRTIQTLDRKVSMKPTKVANGYATDEVSTTFTETGDFMVSLYFDSWMSAIVDPETYVSGFRDDYVRTVLVKALDGEGHTKYWIELLEAYPVNKNMKAATDEAENTVQEITIDWAYSDFNIHNALGEVDLRVRRQKKIPSSKGNENFIDGKVAVGTKRGIINVGNIK